MGQVSQLEDLQKRAEEREHSVDFRISRSVPVEPEVSARLKANNRAEREAERTAARALEFEDKRTLRNEVERLQLEIATLKRDIGQLNWISRNLAKGLETAKRMPGFQLDPMASEALQQWKGRAPWLKPGGKRRAGSG